MTFPLKVPVETADVKVPLNGELTVLLPKTPSLSPTDQSMPCDPSMVGSRSTAVLVGRRDSDSPMTVTLSVALPSPLISF